MRRRRALSRMGLLRGPRLIRKSRGPFGSSQTAQASDFCISSPFGAEHENGRILLIRAWCRTVVRELAAASAAVRAGYCQTYRNRQLCKPSIAGRTYHFTVRPERSEFFRTLMSPKRPDTPHNNQTLLDFRRPMDLQAWLQL